MLRSALSLPKSLLLGLFVFLIASGVLLCQTDTASVSGTVVDESGAVVTDASINLTNNATGQQRTTAANSAGVYSFPNVPPGTYTLAVSKTGFQTNTVSNISLQIQQAFKQDVTLHVGAVSQAERAVRKWR